MKKRAIILSTLLALSLGITACGGNNTSEATPSNETKAEATAEPTIERKEILPKTRGLDSDIYSLYIRASGAAAYEMIRCWLTDDIAKSPKEIVTLLKNFLPTGLITNLV